MNLLRVIDDKSVSNTLVAPEWARHEALVEDGWTVQDLAIPAGTTFDSLSRQIDAINPASVFLAGDVPYCWAGPIVDDGHLGLDGLASHFAPWSTLARYATGPAGWILRPAKDPGWGALSANWGAYYANLSVPGPAIRSVGMVNCTRLVGVDPFVGLSNYLKCVNDYREGLVTFENNALYAQNLKPILTQVITELKALTGNSTFFDLSGHTDGRLFEALRGWSFAFGMLSGGGNPNFQGLLNDGSYLDFIKSGVAIGFLRSYGSWFGDFGQPNTFNRGILAGGKCLGVVWSPTDNALFTPMITEDATVGECVRRMQGAFTWNWCGDPTLRWRFDLTPHQSDDIFRRLGLLETGMSTLLSAPVLNKPPDGGPGVPVPTMIRQINCGGQALAGWEADSNTVGKVFKFLNPVTGASLGIPEAIYESCRYHDSLPFGYIFTGLPSNQSVGLECYFAEPNSAPGVRLINLACNGQALISGMDISGEVGMLRALVKTFRVTSDATGKLDFKVSGHNHLICGLRITT